MDSLAEYKLLEYQQSIQELLSNALDAEHLPALSRITNKKELWKKRLRDQWLRKKEPALSKKDIILMNMQSAQEENENRDNFEARGTDFSSRPHRQELIIQLGEGFFGYDPTKQDWSEDPIQNDKFEVHSIKSKVVVDKFSSAVNLISTLTNLIKLFKENGATKILELKTLQFVIKL